MADPQNSTPQPGSAEYRQAEEMAKKILAIAHKPVDELVRALRLQGWGADHRAIVLEAMAQHALMEARRG